MEQAQTTLILVNRMYSIIASFFSSICIQYNRKCIQFPIFAYVFLPSLSLPPLMVTVILDDAYWAKPREQDVVQKMNTNINFLMACFVFAFDSVANLNTIFF